MESLAMTHLIDEVQQIWAVLVGSAALNEVLSSRPTVNRKPVAAAAIEPPASIWLAHQWPEMNSRSTCSG
jgi:hypothetical protein